MELKKNTLSFNSRLKPVEEFSCLWINIAKTIHFKKVYEDSDEFKQGSVIYEDKENKYKIFANDEFAQYLFCVPAYEDNERYFVGYKIHSYATSYKIAGMFIYFGKNGNVVEKKVIDRIVCNYDERNREPETFLYKQSLVFVQFHRDSNTVYLTLNFFNYSDEFTGNLFLSSLSGKKTQYTGRCLKIMSEPDDICIDLGSVRVEESIISYDQYDFDFEKEPIIPEEQEYSDGYPLNCIKCGSRTLEMELWMKSTLTNLGKAFCKNCFIRFSRTDKQWQCSKLHTSFELCRNPVFSINDFHCSDNHLEFIYEIKSEKTEKRPYKGKGTITVTL